MSLTAEQRRNLPDADFAVPGKRVLPICDARHVSMAWSQHLKASGLTDAERGEAARRIKAKAASLGLSLAGASDGGLYVRRNLTPASAAALTAWAVEQGFTNLTPPEEMHATVVYSRAAVTLTPLTDTVSAAQDADGHSRHVSPLGDKGAVVLHIEAPQLQARWAEAMAAGATWDWDMYRPHVTITYDAAGMDLSGVTPFGGDLVFGPEVHEPLNENWAEDKGLRVSASSMRIEASLDAMALAMPEVYGHPNRMPFSGVLTRLDRPSDKPPGGADGKLVILTRGAAERALPSLLGMAVDFTPSFDGHDATRKIGIITAAAIEGDAIIIDGFVYARDFPKEASRIQTDKSVLGFSWELADVYVERLEADPLVITDACFTGAAILRKDKAAYGSTSLAASAEEHDMTKEEMQALLADAITPVATSIATIAAAQAATDKKVADMAASAEASAKTALEAAEKAAAEAKDGELASLKTQLADLQAAAAKKVEEPARKTFSPQIAAMLAKADLSVPGNGDKLSVGAVDQALAKTDLPPVKRMEIKNELQRAGAL